MIATFGFIAPPENDAVAILVPRRRATIDLRHFEREPRLVQSIRESQQKRSTAMDQQATRLCRDCGRLDAEPHAAGDLCPGCASPRLVTHPELARLSVAHVDCDAYYASIEKRDRPELADQPVVVGGGGMRGVVTTCCYVARRYGVRSAMPMARALQLCPDAVVIPPNMEKYQRDSGRIRALMQEAAERVEQVSIDEAYLDFGEPAARSEPPARSLARLSLQIEKRVGVTVSIGLGANKMLAKLASDMNKPRGFAVIGRDDALDVIGPKPISVLPGVGPVMSRRLEELGLTRVSDLWQAKEDDLIHRFGLWGRRLVTLSRAEDNRRVAAARHKSVTIAAETTFEGDLRRFEQIDPILARMCEILAGRLSRARLAAGGLTLKLRRADRRIITRACKLYQPTARADLIWRAASPILAAETDGTPYRLVGVTATRLVSETLADPPDLFGTPPA
jgi:DNA polymerase-4